jgi:hypothetical protein
VDGSATVSGGRLPRPGRHSVNRYMNKNADGGRLVNVAGAMCPVCLWWEVGRSTIERVKFSAALRERVWGAELASPKNFTRTEVEGPGPSVQPDP